MGYVAVRVGATIAGIAISLTALAGCASAGPETAAAPNASESTDPTPTPTTPRWYFEEDVLTRDPLPAELSVYDAMSVEEFATLSKSEQWLYVSWLTQYRSQFVEWFTEASGWLPNDQPLSPSSDPLDQIEDNNYTYRMAFYATADDPVPAEDGTCGALNPDYVKKILLAANGDVETAMEDAEKILASQGGQSLCPSAQAVGKAFNSYDWAVVEANPGEFTLDGERRPVTQVRFTAGAESVYTVDLFTIETTTFDGKREYRTVANYLYSAANEAARPQ